MQTSQQAQNPQRAIATVAGLAIGATGFLLSFVLAMLMLVGQGNPGFLLIWMVAVTGTAACMRMHAKWRKSFERMYAPEAVRTLYAARKGWRQNVEDIAFREIPVASMPAGQ